MCVALLTGGMSSMGSYLADTHMHAGQRPRPGFVCASVAVMASSTERPMFVAGCQLWNKAMCDVGAWAQGLSYLS